MYFIGFIRAFPVTWWAEELHPISGHPTRVRRELNVEFLSGGAVPDYAREAVAKLPQFTKGIAADLDPYTRVLWHDTEIGQQQQGWTDEQRAHVEATMLAAVGTDFVLADQPRVATPWPAYPKLVAQGRRTIDMVAEKIVETINEMEIDPYAVLAYERENLNRKPVIAAVEALLPSTEPESVEEIVAA